MKKFLYVVLIGMTFSGLSAKELPDKQISIDVVEKQKEFVFINECIDQSINYESGKSLIYENSFVLPKSDFYEVISLYLIDHGLSFRIITYENLMLSIKNSPKSNPIYYDFENWNKALNKVPIHFS